MSGSEEQVDGALSSDGWLYLKLQYKLINGKSGLVG